MDSAQPEHNGDCIEEPSGKVFPNPPDPCGVFGHPEILPRVGDRYQAEIPLLMAKCDYLSLTKNPADAEIKDGFPHGFLMGLPIPIVWIDQESGKITKTPINLKDKNKKVGAEPADIALDCGIRVGTSTNLNLQQEMKNKLHQEYMGKGCCLVPGSLNESWSHMDEARFLLGLYIFGKNLVQVKRFIEIKEMGDILSFYYGKFYRSGKYRRWSECVKRKGRRGVYGQKIFTGVRQQALLSRLLPHVSVEYQDTLLEVSKTFSEGKILLEQYVSSLKDMVGMRSLIEAVGIGKGKRDLTGNSLEPRKSDQLAPVRPEIPIGKACSKLTNGEIINFLTGGFRLSKARSSDLFWEAVWPRLLAKGWHSEQPANLSYAAGSKHSLVFLVPSVGKFSRRQMVKGNHYFDSITDVLNKVATDPDLLELEIEANKDNRTEEDNGLSNEMKLDQDDLSDQQRRCYLKPRTLNCTAELVEFTVVDTSPVDGEIFKLREVRHLPLPASSTYVGASHSKKTRRDFSEAVTNGLDSAGALCFNPEVTNNSEPTATMFGRGVSCDQMNSGGNAPIQAFPINDPVKIANDQDGKKNAVRCHSSQGMKPDNSNFCAPVTKRRRGLTACGRTGRRHSTSSFLGGSRLKEKQAHDSLENPDSDKNILSQVEPSQKKLSIASSSKSSQVAGSEGTLDCTSLRVEHSHEKPQRRRRLTACTRTDISHRTRNFLVGSTSKQGEARGFLENPDSGKSILPQADPSQRKLLSTTSSAKNRQIVTSENILSQTDPPQKRSHATSKKSQNEISEHIISQVDPCQEEQSITPSKNRKLEGSENILLQVDPSKKKLSSTASLSKNIQIISSENILSQMNPSQKRSYITSSSMKSQTQGIENMLLLADASQQKLSITSSENQLESSENILSQADLSQKKSPTTSSSKNHQSESSENILSQVDPSQNKSPIGSPENSQLGGREGILYVTSVSAENSDEKFQHPMLIDLNIPLPVDDETFMMEMVGNQDHQMSKQPDDPNALKTSVSKPSPEHKSNMNSRRQSTRNQTPTTRALEAVASGFLNIKRKRKSAEVFPEESDASTPPRRRRGERGLSENSGSGTVNSRVEEEGNGIHNNSDIMFSKI